MDKREQLLKEREDIMSRPLEKWDGERINEIERELGLSKKERSNGVFVPKRLFKDD